MIRVKNWSKYQSYKDRRPPWIRFHRTILDDFTFQSMSAEARAFLPMLWLLACEHEDPVSGLIPYSYEEIEFRLRMRNGTVTKLVQELQAADFITCIESVTKPLQNRNETVPPETETETETETKDRFAEFWNLYPRKIGKPKAYASWKSATKLDDAKQQEVLDGLKKHLPSLNGKEIQFVPHPTTWLNGHRWQDPVETQKQNTTTEVWKNAI